MGLKNTLCGLAVTVATALGCQPADSIDARLAPKIEMSTCTPAEFDSASCVCTPEQSTEGCVLDFEELSIGRARSLNLTIRNPSALDLDLREIRIRGDGQGVFSLQDPLPWVVISGGQETIVVSFLPVAEGEAVDTLLVLSDAVNTAAQEAVGIALVGIGQDLARPSAVVAPTQCLLEMLAGHTDECRIVLTNEGRLDLKVEQVFLSASSDPVFALNDVPPLPIFLAPGTSVVVFVEAAPTSTGDYTGTLILDTNDQISPRLQVPLQCKARS